MTFSLTSVRVHVHARRCIHKNAYGGATFELRERVAGPTYSGVGRGRARPRGRSTARARHTCACATLSAAVMCQATLSRRPLGLAAPPPRTSTNKSSPRRSLPALATSAKPGGVIGPSHGCHDTPRKPAPHRLFGTRTGSHPSGRTTGTAVARKRSSRRSSRATSAGLSAARSWYSQASAVTLKRQYSSAHCPAYARGGHVPDTSLALGPSQGDRLRGADTEGAVAPLSDGVARGGAVLARRRVPPARHVEQESVS